MNKLVKTVCFGLMLLPMKPLNAGISHSKLSVNDAMLTTGSAVAKSDTPHDAPFDWDSIMDAIILVESEGNPRAVSGNSVGAMQITPVCVYECNNILKARGSEKQYTLDDRYDVAKSKEMFLLIQSHYNKTNNVEKAIRSWNGGPNYTLRGTDGYYKKVMRRMQ